MNRILGQPSVNTAVSPRSPSSDSTRSPMSAGSAHGPRSASTEPGSKRTHIMNQALSPSTVRNKPSELKEVEIPPDAADSSKYKFDETPDPSTRTSALEEDMRPETKLSDYDWAELEDQFAKRMEAFRHEEDAIWEEWKSWGEIFKAWASTISIHEEERASKRLRTRIAFTQGSEESLEAKRQHYVKVVQAFESALMLLGSRNSVHNFI